MTDDGRTGDHGSGAPVDFDRHERIRERFAADDRFVRVDAEPEFAPDRLVCAFDSRFYPASVQSARLEIVYYKNGNFSIHYHEEYADSTFDHRWDRYPSAHNARDHVHPGPDAPTPGEDGTHPEDWRDVLSTILEEIEERQRAFWQD